MERQTIPLSGAHELIVGPTPPVAAPHRAALRRLRRRIRAQLEKRPPSEWHHIEADDVTEPDIDPRFVRTELSRTMAELFPDLPCFRLELADALVEAGEIERALGVAADLYRDWLDLPAAEELIVKLLDHLGRALDSFPWRESAPRVARLDASTAERCRRQLEAHGPSALWELIERAFAEEITLFGEEALARLLAADPRFEVCRDAGWVFVALASEDASPRVPEEEDKARFESVASGFA